MAKVYGKKDVEGHISHMWGVNAALLTEAKRLGTAADRRLQQVRSSTEWVKYDQSTAHLTEIEINPTKGKYTQDYLVSMIGPNAWAFEYGHEPSGIFGPGGKFSHVKTQPPKGTYLMTMTYVQR